MTESHQGLLGRRRVAAIIAVSVGAVMIQMDAMIPSVTLPSVANALDAEPSSVVSVIVAYQLILAMAMMPLAALGDRIGHRRLYSAGLALHIVASVLYGFVNSLPALIAVRMLQALGAASAMSVSVAMVRNIYPPARLGAGLSLNTIANAGGMSLAPVIGGLILSFADWHWVFAAGIPLSAIALLFSRALPEPEPRSHTFDRLGALLCALTFGAVIGGLEDAIHGNHPARSLGVIVTGVVIAFFFVRHERRQLQPVLPVDLLMRPAIAYSVIACFSAVLGSIILIVTMPFRLQQVYGFSSVQIGGVMAFYSIASLICAPLAGYLSDRISVALLGTVGMGLASTALVLTAFLPPHPRQLDVAWRVWLCGAGFGIFFSPNARMIIASAPKGRMAAAGSLFTTTRMLGQAIGATLVAGLLATGLGHGAGPNLVAMCLACVAGGISVRGLRGAKAASTSLPPAEQTEPG